LEAQHLWAPGARAFALVARHLETRGISAQSNITLRQIGLPSVAKHVVGMEAVMKEESRLVSSSWLPLSQAKVTETLPPPEFSPS